MNMVVRAHVPLSKGLLYRVIHLICLENKKEGFYGKVAHPNPSTVDLDFAGEIELLRI